MNRQDQDSIKQARKKGVRRTAIVVALLAFAIFAISILQMLKIS